MGSISRRIRTGAARRRARQDPIPGLGEVITRADALHQWVLARIAGVVRGLEREGIKPSRLVLRAVAEDGLGGRRFELLCRGFDQPLYEIGWTPAVPDPEDSDGSTARWRLEAYETLLDLPSGLAPAPPRGGPGEITFAASPGMGGNK